MKILILGGDGYLGWPTAMDLAGSGHEVLVVDNYYRRKIAEETDSLPLFDTPLLDERTKLYTNLTGNKVSYQIGDLQNHEFTFSVVSDFQPDTIIHYAEQPSAPYSMRGFKEAQETLSNNLSTTFNVIWAMIKFAPNAHLVKLGTMGEYGTPDIDIEEGWIEIEHKGRKDTFLYPRAAGSLYHTTKVLDTDLIWFYVRTYGLSVTDLMQGPVYGLSTEFADLHTGLCPNFHYDDIFGTVVNRFLVQAVADIPLTVYGQGGQTRGYLNLKDTLQCVKLATEDPAKAGELRIFNQLTETFSVNELAAKIQKVGQVLGLNVEIRQIPNPRKEKEDHYYNPVHRGLKDLGLKPTLMTDEVISEMLRRVMNAKSNIVLEKILPRVSWK